MELHCKVIITKNTDQDREQILDVEYIKPSQIFSHIISTCGTSKNIMTNKDLVKMEEEEKIKKQQEEINCVFIVSSPAKGKTNIIKNILLSHSKYFDEVYIYGDYKINYEYIDFESYCIINKLPDRIDKKLIKSI